MTAGRDVAAFGFVVFVGFKNDDEMAFLITDGNSCPDLLATSLR